MVKFRLSQQYRIHLLLLRGVTSLEQMLKISLLRLLAVCLANVRSLKLLVYDAFSDKSEVNSPTIG